MIYKARQDGALSKGFQGKALMLGSLGNMVSAAAGMSRAGYIPIVDTFAAFGVTKGNLPHIWHYFLSVHYCSL